MRLPEKLKTEIVSHGGVEIVRITVEQAKINEIIDYLAELEKPTFPKDWGKVGGKEFGTLTLPKPEWWTNLTPTGEKVAYLACIEDIRRVHGIIINLE